MPDPTAAFVGACRRFMVTGHVVSAIIHDGLTEIGLLSGNTAIGPTLMLMWTGENRVIGGSTENFGTPGMRRIQRSSGGLTGSRWVRVVNRPTDGASTSQPIREQHDGVHGGCPNFQELGRSAGLVYGGFGGARASYRVVDPLGIWAGEFVEGRMVAVYAVEVEDGATVGEGEDMSGVVLADAEEEEIDGFTVYTFTVGTLADLYGQEGMSGRACTFLDATFEEGSDYAGVYPFDSVVSSILAAHPFHVIAGLHAHKAIHHLALNHMWADIDGARYRLAEITDWRCDYGNLDGGGGFTVPIIGVPEGNLMGAIANMLPKDSGLLGYQDSVGHWTITIDHEWKATPDATLDSISDHAYSIRRVTGKAHPIGQVRLVQSPIAQPDATVEALIVDYPTTRDATGSFHQPELPILFNTAAAATRHATGIYDRGNAERDKLIVETRGRLFDLHNKASYDGETWSVESYTQARNARRLGPLKRRLVLRKVG